MPYASAQADLQAKDNYRGQGQARATAIQQGKLPPIRRIASAKHLAFVPVDEAAVRLNQESRASTLEDLAETPHAPDLVYHSQIASDTFRATFLKFPDLEDIESFERPAGFSAGPSERAVFERQLGEERDAQRNHLEQLHDLNTWQFRTLVKDVIQQEDWEIKDAARSRATSSDRVIAVARWSEKQRSYLTKRQLETTTKFTEHTLIRQLPLLTTLYPPRSAVPPPSAAPTTSASTTSLLPQFPRPKQPTNSNSAAWPDPTATMRSAPPPHQHNVGPQPPTGPAPLPSQRHARQMGTLPINRSEYDAMPEAERYNVAKYLHSDRHPAHWRTAWSEDDSDAMWPAYSTDHEFQSAVKALVESKQTTDPRKR